MQVQLLENGKEPQELPFFTCFLCLASAGEHLLDNCLYTGTL